MSHRIHKERIPSRALGESKTKGSGTTRVVAESNHDGLLNPNSRWDFVRRKRTGQPTANLRYLSPSSRKVRRQRMGRAGQRSSSESKTSREGSAGFPTGNASRRNVSRKVGEAEQASHRASRSKSRQSRSGVATYLRTPSQTTRNRREVSELPKGAIRAGSPLFYLSR